MGRSQFFRHGLVPMLLAFVFALGLSTKAAADAIYTFEAPVFVAPQTTPLLDRPPNVPDPLVPGLLTSFTASPLATGFAIFAAPFNPLLSGQVLFDPGGAGPDSLSLTFSVPIFGLSVDFALAAPPGGPFGQLRLVTPVGSTSQTAGNFGGTFQGGTLVFTSATSFTTAVLTGFSVTGQQTFFAIDDLRLITQQVPEPATILLIGVGAVALARRCRRA